MFVKFGKWEEIMSRIGRTPIKLPEGVKVDISNDISKFSVKAKLGTWIILS